MYPPVAWPPPRRPLALALALALPAVAAAHQPPPRYPRLRPTVEVSSWVGLGGGALVAGDASRSVFDLRLGGDATFDVGGDGDVRAGLSGSSTRRSRWRGSSGT